MTDSVLNDCLTQHCIVQHYLFQILKTICLDSPAMDCNVFFWHSPPPNGLFILLNFGWDYILSAARPANDLLLSYNFVLKLSPVESFLQSIVEIFLQHDWVQCNHNNLQLKAHNSPGYYISAINTFWYVLTKLYLNQRAWCTFSKLYIRQFSTLEIFYHPQKNWNYCVSEFCKFSGCLKITGKPKNTFFCLSYPSLSFSHCIVTNPANCFP